MTFDVILQVLTFKNVFDFFHVFTILHVSPFYMFDIFTCFDLLTFSFSARGQDPNFQFGLFHKLSYIIPGVEHSGEDCWSRCNQQPGKCDWCGTNGWCCRKGEDWIGNGCDGTFGGQSQHLCVLDPSLGESVDDFVSEF